MSVGLPGTDFITINKNRLTPLEQWALTTDEPLVKSIEFDDQRRIFCAVLRDGRHVCFPLELFSQLQNITNDEHLHNVVAINMGAALYWADIDVHYSANELIADVEAQKLDQQDLLSALSNKAMADV